MERTEFYNNFMGELWQQDLAFVNYRIEAAKKLVRRFVPKNSKVLEVGCGNGLITAELCKVAKSVTATDLSAVAMENCRRYVKGAKNLTYYIGNVAHPKFSQNFKDYDAIVLCDVLEHIPPSERGNLFAFIWLALKPNGSVILTWPNPEAQKTNPQVVEEAVDLIEICKVSNLQPYYFSYVDVDSTNHYIHCVLRKQIPFVKIERIPSFRIKNFGKKWLQRLRNLRLFIR
jgi:2-polyprenyl-3-methyl-5-hydroxy-6-metoxy-1,4-benzoquinol methylase